MREPVASHARTRRRVGGVALLLATAALAGGQSGAAGGEPDVEAPRIVALSLSPASVDISDGPGVVTATATITDASGVESAALRLIPPASNSGVADGEFEPKGGNLYEARIQIPRWARTGVWRGDFVFVSDVVGNTRYRRTSLIRSQQVTVTGTSDLKAPTMTGLTLTPASADVSAAAVKVTARATLKDAVSGVSYAFIHLGSPSGKQRAIGSFEPVGGNVYEAQLHIPRFAETGRWQVVYAGGSDNAGNSNTWLYEESPYSVRLTGVSDTEPPRVVAVEPLEADVDPSGGSVSFTVRATITDDLSGVAEDSGCDDGCWGTMRPTIRFQNPSAPRPWPGPSHGTGQMAFGTFERVAGDEFEATVTIPAGGESGRWTTSFVMVSDRAGNSIRLGTDLADYLVGDEADDVLDGIGGNDVERARAGDDLARGGAGADRLFGEMGRDRLLGQAGRDQLWGGAGRDRLEGGAGADRLFGGPGRDVLRGGPGRDVFEGGPGNDVIWSRDGVAETVRCGAGVDRVRADAFDRLAGCERRF